jgi:hypothetical protein
MMQEENYNRDSQEEIFSKRVRAGKRTYFFDVKATRNNDYYITITESKRSKFDDGNFVKMKIHLYKEDFLYCVQTCFYLWLGIWLFERIHAVGAIP